MEKDERVQFVRFETTLNKEEFVKRWEQYSHSLNSNADVILQQSEKGGVFTYIAQHRSASGELEFKFANEARASRIMQVPIRTTQAGGYSILQANRLQDSTRSESKIFIFFTDPQIDLTIYTKLFENGNVNIYQAYYENCRYSYVLECYVKTKDAPALLEQIKQHTNFADAGIYKEWIHVQNVNSGKEKGLHVWPTV